MLILEFDLCEMYVRLGCGALRQLLTAWSTQISHALVTYKLQIDTYTRCVLGIDTREENRTLLTFSYTYVVF